VYRSWTNQKRLRDRYEKCLRDGMMGKKRGCMFPANKPGDSAHNYGFAWDSVVEDRYQAWWDMVRRLAGFEVLPNDLIHAQLTRWRDFAVRPDV